MSPAKQHARKPLNPKVRAVGVGGAVVTVVAFLLPLFGVELPGDYAAAIASAINTLIVVVAGYQKA